jgi:hypothetical protein
MMLPDVRILENGDGIPRNEVRWQRFLEAISLRIGVDRTNHVGRHDSVRVPILEDAPVVDQSKDASQGRRDIRLQDGLPNDLDPDAGIGEPGEPLIDCGSPPQAHGSGRREQDEHTNLPPGRVEGVAERLEGFGSKSRKRRLTRRDVSGRPTNPCEDGGRSDDHDPADEEEPVEDLQV